MGLFGRTFDSPSLRQCVLYYGLLMAVLLTAFWPFADLPGYYFTKGETGAMLYSARIETPEDLVRILTHSLKSGLKERAIYFRPVSTLSFSLDYALWGLNPIGYHLTDLILHVAVAGLLFRVVYLFTGRDVWSGALAGVLYSLHPLLVHVVPAIVYRQETLAASFLLAGMWAFYHREYGGGGGGALTAALGCFVLSVGAKEVGIVFVPLVLVHVWLALRREIHDWQRRVMKLVKRAWPYVLTGGVYVCWWLYVTRSRALLGGGQTMKPPVFGDTARETVLQIVLQYSGNVLPEFFRATFFPYRPLYGWIATHTFGWTSAGGWVLLVVGMTAVGVLVCIGLTMGGFVDVRTFFQSVKRVLKIERPSDKITTAMFFFVVWYVVLAFFYIAVNTMSFKHAYHGVLPFSAGFSVLIVAGVRAIGRRLTPETPRTGTFLSTRVVASSLLPALGVVVGFLHVGLLVRDSPLVREYPTWKHQQAITRQYRTMLIRQLNALPSGSSVVLRGAPPVWSGREAPLPNMNVLSRILRLRRWIDMRFPEQTFRIDRRGLRGYHEPCPCPLWLEKERVGSHYFVFTLRKG